MAANVEEKKIPGFIKKLNKFLGLPSKSERVMDILSISVNTEKINDNAGSINNITGSINVNAESIINITGTVRDNAEKIAKNTADIAIYHPPSKLHKTSAQYR